MEKLETGVETDHCSMTVLIPVRCPHCGSSEVVRHGKSTSGKQRFR